MFELLTDFFLRCKIGIGRLHGLPFLFLPSGLQGLSKSLAMRDQMEVGTAFAAEYVSPQYPDHYNRAFAFSILLYPQPQQIALRRSCLFPKG